MSFQQNLRLPVIELENPREARNDTVEAHMGGWGEEGRVCLQRPRAVGEAGGSVVGSRSTVVHCRRWDMGQGQGRGVEMWSSQPEKRRTVLKKNDAVEGDEEGMRRWKCLFSV